MSDVATTPTPSIPPASPATPSGNPLWTGMTPYLEALKAKQVRMVKSRKRAAVWFLGLTILFFAAAIFIRHRLALSLFINLYFLRFCVL